MTLQKRLDIYKRHGVLVLPEDICVQYKPEPNSVLIRIKADAFLPLVHRSEYADVLELMYDDVDRESQGTVISHDQVVQVINFFEQHRGKKMVIHCAAGVSRSSATACAWAYFNGLPEAEEEIRQTHCFVPNARVYRELWNEIERRERSGL